MRTVRIFFSKTGEAAYISHLDLQRVMSRALRKSGMPVWWSQGFNPHIYMSFALPLPLGVESLCEAVDVKTEDDEGDLSTFMRPLSGALPKGIEVSAIREPVHAAGEIASAEYTFSHPDGAAFTAAVGAYNDARQAMVIRKTKRSEQQVNFKDILPNIVLLENAQGRPVFKAVLPAGSTLNYSPMLVLEILDNYSENLKEQLDVVRTNVFVSPNKGFE